MKRTITLIGKNYDVTLEEGKKVVTVKSVFKDGMAGKVVRIWNSFEYVVDDYKEMGFVEE